MVYLCPVFKWSEYSGGSNTEHVQIWNGWHCLDLEWHSKAEQPDHFKSNQIAAILNSYALVPFCDKIFMVKFFLMLALLRTTFYGLYFSYHYCRRPSSISNARRML